MKQEENNQSCVHLDQANQKIDPNTPEGCEECLQTGSSWYTSAFMPDLWSRRMLR